MGDYTVKNDTLKAVRISMGMSQDDFARAVREAGLKIGEPNECSKRTVQRLESGETSRPHPYMGRAIQEVTGLPLASLGFDLPAPVAGEAMPTSARVASNGNLSGVWLSRYEFRSDSRNDTYVGLHYIAVVTQGERLQCRSLPRSNAEITSSLSLDLTQEGQVVTGTWREATAEGSYYKGATYYGAIQMLIDPTGRKMTGQWVGFGRRQEIKNGAWHLIWQTASLDKATMAEYSRTPEDPYQQVA